MKMGLMAFSHLKIGYFVAPKSQLQHVPHKYLLRGSITCMSFSWHLIVIVCSRSKKQIFSHNVPNELAILYA